MMLANVTADRLSRQELSWLLAQVARGAAKALRDGVTHLQPPLGEAAAEEPPPSQRVDTLDALEDALDVLSQLPAPATAQARYGRFDLAALLYEVAPDARIAIEPGAGTEVFGDRNELRRMLHVLVNHTHGSPVSASSAASPEVHICGEQEMVRVSVALGPESSATREIERRWLSRMATRLGGSVELSHGTQALLFPADGASERRQLQELRKELEQAQELGVAYARELAETLDHSSSEPPRPSTPEPGQLEPLLTLGHTLVRSFVSWTQAIEADAELAASLLGQHTELTLRLRRRAEELRESLEELEQLASCPPAEASTRVDCEALTEECLRRVETRAARHSVELQLSAEPELTLTGRREQLGFLLTLLLHHAIAASPRGSVVSVRLSRGAAGEVVWQVDDAGAPVPPLARSGLLLGRTDASTYGRPVGAWLPLARYLAAEHSSALQLDDAPSGGTRVSVRFAMS